jgi:RNA polymerase sigma-70 factor (ECF subfamily)
MQHLELAGSFPTIDLIARKPSLLVMALQDGCPQAEEELYHCLSRGMRYMIRRKLLPEDVDDILHASFMDVVLAIRSQKLREPDALMGFTRTIISRKISHAINFYIQRRKQEPTDGKNAEQLADRKALDFHQLQEQREYMRSCLQKLSDVDRDLLTRFYLLEQSKEKICDELDISQTSFRLAKSRAKAKLNIKRQSARVTVKTPTSR